jgi:hypothetical protein
MLVTAWHQKFLGWWNSEVTMQFARNWKTQNHNFTGNGEVTKLIVEIGMVGKINQK